MLDGTALIRNWIVVDANTSYLFPELDGNGTGGNGTVRPSPTASSSGGPGQYTGAAGSVVRGERVMGVGGAVVAAIVGSLLVL